MVFLTSYKVLNLFYGPLDEHFFAIMSDTDVAVIFGSIHHIIDVVVFGGGSKQLIVVHCSSP